MILGAVFSLARGAPAPAADPSAALIDLALEGDRRGFEGLYRDHAGPAFRLLTRLVGPVPERDDLMQQVFLEAFRSLASFRRDAAFSTWLHRIVVNVAYRHLRRQRQRNGHEVGDDHPAAGGSPEHAASRQQDLARALGYLSALKPDKRIAFVLRVVEGMTLDEIGALVGASAPAVGQRVKYAQRELSAMVERDRRRSMEVS
jgi:RNA polymerase sigma-70 factor (ECF subfamily)